MRIIAVALMAMGLAGCEDGLSDNEREAQDIEAAERVRELNEAGPPLQEIVPEPILLPDLEANDLFGETCAYAPGTSMGARVIARETDAYMKIEGEMIRFAADPGSRELPAKTRTLYNSREYSLRLAIEDSEPRLPDGEAGSADETRSQGTIWLRDRYDRVVYQGTGAVECGET